jgi:hypothetical protein
MSPPARLQATIYLDPRVSPGYARLRPASTPLRRFTPLYNLAAGSDYRRAGWRQDPCPRLDQLDAGEAADD